MKPMMLAALMAMAGGAAHAEAVKYELDASHSQVLFSYSHFGFSTTFGMFSGFEGDIFFDEAAPENSSVSVSMPVTLMFTGWEERDEVFLGEDFFDASNNDVVTFRSTAIELTGDQTAKITGDLELNGVTKSVVLDTRLNLVGQNPVTQKAWLGFDATTTVLRSEFGLGAFAPLISDEVELRISVEAGIADGA